MKVKREIFENGELRNVLGKIKHCVYFDVDLIVAIADFFEVFDAEAAKYAEAIQKLIRKHDIETEPTPGGLRFKVNVETYPAFEAERQRVMDSEIELPVLNITKEIIQKVQQAHQKKNGSAYFDSADILQMRKWDFLKGGEKKD